VSEVSIEGPGRRSARWALQVRAREPRASGGCPHRPDTRRAGLL